MGEPDILESGPADRPRRRWPWLVGAAVVVLVGAGLTVAYVERRHRLTVPGETVHTGASTEYPGLLPEGYGYQVDGGRLVLSLRLLVSGPGEVTLDQATVEPVAGVTVDAAGFAPDGDRSGRIDPTRTARTGDTVVVVIRYTVDCAALRAPWPYLGTVTVVATGGFTRVTTPLVPPSGPAAPSPPPCPASGS